jgi:hypothetical protein
MLIISFPSVTVRELWPYAACKHQCLLSVASKNTSIILAIALTKESLVLHFNRVRGKTNRGARGSEERRDLSTHNDGDLVDTHRVYLEILYDGSTQEQREEGKTGKGVLPVC